MLILRFCLLLAGAALVPSWRPLAAQPPASTAVSFDFVVVANNTGLPAVTIADIRRIFRGEQSLWPTKQAVTVVLPSVRTDFTDLFARQALGMTRSGMQRFWLALVFQGRANPPVLQDSAADVIAFVQRTPGAIGMVPTATPGIPRALVIRVLE
jgi:ABC-type phosphate transport system substrate-binding protein